MQTAQLACARRAATHGLPGTRVQGAARWFVHLAAACELRRGNATGEGDESESEGEGQTREDEGRGVFAVRRGVREPLPLNGRHSV